MEITFSWRTLEQQVFAHVDWSKVDEKTEIRMWDDTPIGKMSIQVNAEVTYTDGTKMTTKVGTENHSIPVDAVLHLSHLKCAIEEVGDYDELCIDVDDNDPKSNSIEFYRFVREEIDSCSGYVE